MPHPHGTINRYNNQRCRCDQCRAAIRDYRREQRDRTRTIEQAAPSTSEASAGRVAVMDAETVAKLSIGGHAMWICGHINTWPGVDVVHGLGWPTDISRYPCPQCKTIGILGTTDPWERPDIPRAPQR
jgi:hypothetical protein